MACKHHINLGLDEPLLVHDPHCLTFHVMMHIAMVKGAMY